MSRRRSLVTVEFDKADLRDALRGLRELEGRFRRGAVREAVRKGAAPMRQRAKALAPNEQGFTKKSIGTKVRTYKDGNVVAVTGPRRGPAYIYTGVTRPIRLSDRTVISIAGRPVKRVPANTAHLVEFGTAPHALGKGAQAGRGPGQRGRTASQHGAMHPGTKPRPFLRPAFDQAAPQSRARVVAALRESIPKFLARQQARAAQRAGSRRPS